MNALRKLQKLEAEITEQLAGTLGCDEDDLPVEIDLLRVYNCVPEDRKEELVSNFYISYYFFFLFFLILSFYKIFSFTEL
jgi:hypothetical protein